MKTSITPFFLAFFILCLLSCELGKEPIVTPKSQAINLLDFSGLSVKNGIVAFESLESYSKFMDKISNMSQDDLAKIGEKLKFRSYLNSYINRLLFIREKLKAGDDITNYINDKYVNCTGDVPKPRINHFALSSVLNQEGIFIIADKAFRLEDDKEYITSASNVQSLLRANKLNSISSGVDVINLSDVMGGYEDETELNKKRSARIQSTDCVSYSARKSKGDWFWTTYADVETRVSLLAIPDSDEGTYRLEFEVASKGNIGGGAFSNLTSMQTLHTAYLFGVNDPEGRNLVYDFVDSSKDEIGTSISEIKRYVVYDVISFRKSHYRFFLHPNNGKTTYYITQAYLPGLYTEGCTGYTNLPDYPADGYPTAPIPFNN